MRITGGGNVGIGTAFSGINTASQLTIKASVADGNQIYIVQSNDDRGWRLNAKTDGHFYLQSTYTSSNSNVLVARYDTGNVGIGTSSPSYRLDIANTSAQMSLTATDATGYNEIYFRRNTSSTMGYIGVGVNSAVTAAGNEFVIQNSISGGNIVFRTNYSGTIAERMFIACSGNQFIFACAPSSWMAEMYNDTATTPYGIYIKYRNAAPNSSASYFLNFDDSGFNRFHVSSDGYVHSRSTSIVIISSDENLKKDISNYDKGLSEVLKMKPRYYRYKAEPEKLQIGFIAQEMDIALSGSMIDSNEKNKETGESYKTYHLEWYPLLVKAIQELKTQNDALQSRIETLESK